MLLMVAVVAAFSAVSFNAVANEKDACDKQLTATHEMTLTGKIILQEDAKGDIKATDKVEKTKEVIDIKGFEKITIKYALVEADGSEIALPIPKARPGEKAIDLAALVGKNVKLVAKGKIKDGKKCIAKILSVEEEAASPETPASAETPAEVPAAPAAE
jgi:hypothetical protein